MALGQEGADLVARAPGQPGHDHGRGVTLRAPDVVPHDVVHAGHGGLLGDGQVVGPHLGAHVVGEAAVRTEGLTVGRLQHPVLVAGRPRRLREDRIAEGHDAADDPHAEAVQLVQRGLERVAGLDGADLVRQLDLRVVADDAFLVLQVQLDGVDAVLVDHAEDAGLELRIGPGLGRDVDAVRLRVGDGYRDRHGRLVAGAVGGRDHDRRGRRDREAERDLRPVHGGLGAGRLHVGCAVRRPLEGQGLVDRDGFRRSGEADGRRRAVDDEPARRRDPTERASIRGDGQDVAAVDQDGQAEAQLRADRRHARDVVATEAHLDRGHVVDAAHRDVPLRERGRGDHLPTAHAVDRRAGGDQVEAQPAERHDDQPPATSQPTRRIGRRGSVRPPAAAARAPPPTPQLADAAQRRALVRDPAVVGAIVDRVELDAARVGAPTVGAVPAKPRRGDVSGARGVVIGSRSVGSGARGACGSRTRQRRLSGDGTGCFARGLHGWAPSPWRKMRHVTHAGTDLARAGGQGGRVRGPRRRGTPPGATARFLRMQPSDISGIVSAGAPVVSPDGSMVAFVVGRVDQPANRYRSQIWVADGIGRGAGPAAHAGEKGDGIPGVVARRAVAGLHLPPRREGRGDHHPRDPRRRCRRDADDRGHEGRRRPTSPGRPTASSSPSRPARPTPATTRTTRPSSRPGKITHFFSRLNDEGWVYDRPSHIYVVPADGTEAPRDLTPGEYSFGGPAWLADSSGVVVPRRGARHVGPRPGRGPLPRPAGGRAACP